MDLTSDHPYWTVSNGLLNSYPPLREDLICDCAVIGGGITGALVAFHLVEAGISCVVLDKRDIGTGSTSGSTGLLQYEVDVPLRRLIQQVGRSNANRSYRVCLEALLKLGALIARLHIKCDFRRRPSVQLARFAHETADLREEFELRRKIGINLEFWSAAEILERFPFKRPAALFSEDGGCVDPHSLTHGLLEAGCRRGLRIFDRTEAIKLLPGRNGIRIVTDRSFVVKAKRTVIAAGFESKKYLGKAGGRLKSTYALVSEPVADLSQWHRRCLIWETGQPYLYARTLQDNRIFVGGEDENFTDPRYRDELIGRKARILQRKFRKLFPNMGLETAYAWAGTFGETKDGLAYIGPHRSLPHAYFALGCGGNGITYSLIAAEIIRDGILGRNNPDAALFSFNRNRRSRT